MGYNNEMSCRSANMNLEEIDREREMSGWNQYEGEEEPLGKSSGRNQYEEEEEPQGEMMWHIREQESRERDLRRLQTMYPETARVLLPYIEEVCDELEYEGSMMYDERPDYETVLRIGDKVLERVKDLFELVEQPQKDEMLIMQYRSKPSKRRRGNWPEDMIRLMLLEEMHRRRCRRC